MKDKRILKEVYFVRHGQSVGNISNVFQGVDSPLSEEGQKQAKQIAERISHIPFDILIASPQTRAKTTAEEIQKKTGRDILFSDLFIERIKPTSVCEKSCEDKQAMDTFKKWEESLVTSGMRVEDGDNFDDVIDRANKALRFIEDMKESTIVVVSHGHFIRTILSCAIFGEELTDKIFEKFMSSQMENTGITVMRYMKKRGVLQWRLFTYNDIAHLGE